MRRPDGYDSNLSRRRLLRHLAVASGAVAASSWLGCARSTPVRRINFWGTGTLDIEDWSDLERTKYIQVEFQDNQNDPGPVLEKLIEGREAQSRHVSGLQGGVERELVAREAVVPWDLKRLPNFTQLWPWAREIEHTRVNGEQIGIPTVVNADSMIYLPQRTGEVDSYATLFCDDMRGRASMEDAWFNSVAFAAIYLKEAQGHRIDNPCNLTEPELRSVMAFLSDKARAGHFRKLWRGWKDAVDLIANQEVWIMTGWEPIAYEARRRGTPAGYAIPKEGYEGWSNDVLLHPGAQRDGLYEACHEFIDWELGGHYGCRLATMRGYVVPTDASIQHAELHPQTFDVDGVRRTVENVKSKFFQMKGRVHWQNVRPTLYQLYEEEWARFRALF